MRFEESYWDMFRAYRALAGFRALDYGEGEDQKFRNDRRGNVVSTPFFTVREEGPATLKSCGTALVTSSEWLSDRFFPLSLKVKDKNVRFSVPSVCRYQLCRRPDSHF